MRRTGDVLLGLVASALVGVGCSNPPAGQLPPTSPPVTSPTTTPPATPTGSPDLSAGLEAALNTYFDGLYAAGLDPAGKTDALAALIDPKCECRRVIDVLREEGRQRHTIDYRYELRDVRVIDVDASGGDVSYTVHRTSGAKRAADGRVLERYGATTQKYSARFSLRRGSWLLSRITRFA